jgi:hypothetical protein
MNQERATCNNLIVLQFAHTIQTGLAFTNTCEGANINLLLIDIRQSHQDKIFDGSKVSKWNL